MKPFATLIAGVLLAGTAVAGDVYVTTDAKGNKIYTDTPQSIPAQKLDIHSQSTDPATAAKEYSSEMKRYGQHDKANSKAAGPAGRRPADGPGHRRGARQALHGCSAAVPGAHEQLADL